MLRLVMRRHGRVSIDILYVYDFISLLVSSNSRAPLISYYLVYYKTKEAGQALREDAPDVRSRLLVSPDIDATKNRMTSPILMENNKATTNQQSSSTQLPPIKKRKYQECTNDARSREGVCVNGRKEGYSMEKVVSSSKAASRRNIIDLSTDDDNDYKLSNIPSKKITMGGKLQQITPQRIYQKHEIASLKNEITSRDEEIAQLKQTLGGIVARDVQILERNEKIVTNIRELELKDTRMKKKMRLYKAKKNNEIASLKDQVALKENDIIRLKAELNAKDENEKKLVQVKQEEREEAWITLEDVREDLEIANETVTQQAVFTDGWQSKFDKLATIAQAAGVDALTILGIRDQSIA